jgi:hypothetical protein
LNLAQEIIKKIVNKSFMAQAIKKTSLGRGLSALLKDPRTISNP